MSRNPKAAKGHGGMGSPEEVRKRVHSGEMHIGAVFPVDRQAWLRDRVARLGQLRTGRSTPRPPRKTGFSGEPEADSE